MKSTARFAFLSFLFLSPVMSILGQPGSQKDSAAKVSDPEIAAEKFEVKPGTPLGARALVTAPPAINGVQSWSLETIQHRGRLHYTALRPDGKMLATGGIDGTIRLWDVETGKLIKALIDRDGHAYGFSFSPGSRYLACGGPTARVWEVQTGKLLKLLKEHPAPVGLTAWTPNGRYLIGTGGASGEVSCWDLFTGIREKKVALGRPIRSLSVHPDGERVALTGPQMDVMIWNRKTGKPERSLGEFTNDYYAVDWSPDGKVLAVGAAKATYLYDLATAKLTATIESPGHLLAWSADGSRLTTVSHTDRTIKIWNSADLSLKQTIKTYANSFHLLPDEVRLLAEDTYSVSIWELASGKQLRSQRIADTGPPIWLSDRPMVTGVGENTLVLWDTATGKRLHKLEGHTSAISEFAWAPGGKSLATVSADRTVRVWDTGNGTIRHVLKQPAGAVLAMAWSPDGKQLATAGRNKAAIIWDATSGQPAQTLTDQGEEVRALAWSPSGTGMIAFAGKGGIVHIYATDNWKKFRMFKAGSETRGGSDIYAVAWSADAKTLYSGHADGQTRLWSLATGKQLNELEKTANPPAVTTLAMSPRADLLVIGRGPQTLILWDVRKGQRARALGSLAPIQNTAWIPTGTLLAVASADRTCRFFDPETGNLRGVYLAETDQVIAVSVDGHYRADGPAVEGLIYVFQTSKGQETMPPAQFAAVWKWKNNPGFRFTPK